MIAVVHDANGCSTPRGMPWVKLLGIKARLVAKGYFHVARVYFNETFAPMAKFITIRCITALELAMNWKIH